MFHARLSHHERCERGLSPGNICELSFSFTFDRGGVFNDTAMFDLGFTCNSPVKPSNAEENSVSI